MRLTQQRATIIDNIRAYGAMTPDAMLSRVGGSKRNLQRILKGLEEEGCTVARGDEIRLTPTGYMAVGSFPPKSEG